MGSPLRYLRPRIVGEQVPDSIWDFSTISLTETREIMFSRLNSTRFKGSRMVLTEWETMSGQFQ